MSYQCIANSPEGLVQQVAVSYLRHGYLWYVAGRIPAGKNPESIDCKLIDKYEIALNERQRAVRKARGIANMQYIRFDNWFLLMATAGHHPCKQEERIQDCRRCPIRFEGYSISYRRSGITPKGGGPVKWHSCVRIEQTTYIQLKTYLSELAKRQSKEIIEQAFRAIPYSRYAPIRRQLLNILRAVNKTREQAGFAPLPTSCLDLRRRIVQPFHQLKEAA